MNIYDEQNKNKLDDEQVKTALEAAVNNNPEMGRRIAGVLMKRGANTMIDNVLSGSKEFIKSFGQGATGGDIDLQGNILPDERTSGWQNRLGGIVGREFGNTALERALYGEYGKRNLIPSANFVNDPATYAKMETEVAKARKLKQINEDIKYDKLQQAMQVADRQMRPKSITSSGDLTFEYLPSEEDIDLEIARAAKKAAVTEEAKSPTQAQSQAYTYVTRMEEANKTLGEIDSLGKFAASDLFAQAKSPAVFGMQAKTPNVMKSPRMQKFEQAKRNFINAVLRKESGAQIAQSEFDNADLQYFRQPGDSPEVVRQKAENRRLAIEGMKAEAGRAFRQREQQVNNDPLGIR